MMSLQVDIKNRLTREEEELFSILKEVGKKMPSTTIRVVGGWVRDKLLGISSDDIDIMLDNISGEVFARHVTKFLKVRGPHLIKENPEKSKHIQTAKAYIPLSTGKIQEVDFAIARSEVYTATSRIPDIKPATAQEDAMRRDLTINSLFYNLNKDEVEDFTGKGIHDVRTSTIRTPMNPLKTFMDDPLRIFRTIRFAAQYKGKISNETYRAMSFPSIRDKINQKISKERIGTEISKMLKNPHPLRAIKLLKDTGLWNDIVVEALKGTCYEGKMASFDMDQNTPYHHYTLWQHTVRVIKNIMHIYEEADAAKRAVMILAALVHDLGKLYSGIQAASMAHPGTFTYYNHQEASADIALHILRYLKMGPYIKQVAGLAIYHMRPRQLLKKRGSDAPSLRRFIRQMKEHSLDWQDVFNLARADACSKTERIDKAEVQQYKSLEKRLRLLEEETITVPVLNGNEVMNILHIEPGPWMSTIMEFLKELRDKNPRITKKEAATLLKEKYLNSLSKL
ncbi:MAG: HD domain-containing protein [bacterium]